MKRAQSIGWNALRQARLMVFSAVATVMLTGCRSAASIPGRVSDQEYALYAAWTTHALMNEQSKALFFYSRTMPFDPSNTCGRLIHSEDNIAWAMIRQLYALGTAEYPLDLRGNHPFRISWEYKEIDRPPADPSVGYHAVTFSRAAFNRAGDEALFSVSDSCAAGQCGGGSAVLAHRTHGTWQFQRLHCAWVF